MDEGRPLDRADALVRFMQTVEVLTRYGGHTGLHEARALDYASELLDEILQGGRGMPLSLSEHVKSADEVALERSLVKLVRSSGGLAVKFSDESDTGAPDRIIFYPGGKVFFVETKRPHKDLEPKQVRYAATLRELGFCVYRARTLSDVYEILAGEGCSSDGA